MNNSKETIESGVPMLKPIDIKRQARVSYATVMQWLTIGHPRAGVLPSVDLSESKNRHCYRICPDEWRAFLLRLQSQTLERQRSKPLPRPESLNKSKRMFRY